MDINQFHFAHPLWLWGLLVIPAVGIVLWIFFQKKSSFCNLEKWIDPHLLPYLLVNRGANKSLYLKSFLLWTFVWLGLTMALAGPRWSFREMETFSEDKSLVVLLDLSESMNATDLKPSRLIRAKQKIEDLLNLSKGVKIGLIAFAADPHMMAPLTEDKETIRHLLPSLDTDLVYVQGSRLLPALEMASTLLSAEPGSNKAVLIISDGGFEDSSAIISAKKLGENGVVIHTMGIGTAEGAPLYSKGNSIKKNGTPVLSKLDRERLEAISNAGNGKYLEAHYSDREEKNILDELDKRAQAKIKEGRMNRFWDEHFYLFILPVLPVFLYWFRRGVLFSWFVLFMIAAFKVEGVPIQNYFKNSEERGKAALEEGDCESAAAVFQDAYRKGVSYYRAKNYEEAEKMFAQSIRPEVSIDAAYNLGNALVQQNKLKEAKKVYKKVLKEQPQHVKAKANLELVEKMMQQQKQKNSQQGDSNEDENDEQEDEQAESNSKKQDKNKESSAGESESQTSDNNEKNQEEGKNRQNEKERSQNQDDVSNEKEMNKQQNAEEEERDDEENEARTAESEKLEESEAAQSEKQEGKKQKSEKDREADVWLDRMTNDSKIFLKNKCTIESKKNNTKKGVDPW